MSIENLSELAALAAVCIAAVNIIVEVLKSFWLKKETSRKLAVWLTSEAVSFFVIYAYCMIENTSFAPMIAAGGFAGGFFIAYGAMFGYDKLYGEMLDALKKLF